MEKNTDTFRTTRITELHRWNGTDKQENTAPSRAHMPAQFQLQEKGFGNLLTNKQVRHGLELCEKYISSQKNRLQQKT